MNKLIKQTLLLAVSVPISSERLSSDYTYSTAPVFATPTAMSSKAISVKISCVLSVALASSRQLLDQTPFIHFPSIEHFRVGRGFNGPFHLRLGMAFVYVISIILVRRTCIYGQESIYVCSPFCCCF